MRVVAAGRADPAVPGVEFINLTPPWNAGPIFSRTRLEHLLFTIGRVRNIPRRVRRTALKWIGLVRHLAGRPAQYEREYWTSREIVFAFRALENVSAHVVVANDLDALPLALRVARGAPVVFDAHEYSPREYDDDRWFRIYRRPFRTYLCRTYIPQTAAMTTVCEGIAVEYERLTGVRPAVVTNAPDYEPTLAPSVTTGPGRRLRLVHHGVATPVRKIELMIQVMDLLDQERFELSLMFGSAEPGYVDYLHRLAGALPNVKFLPPVPMRELPRFLNQFDVGMYLLQPTNFNNLHSLPNKFFEFVQARLAVAVGPSPEMASIVRRHDLGVVAGDFTVESFADALRRLDRTAVEHHKRQAHASARELSAERNAEIVRGLVEAVTVRDSGVVATS
jgi:hypothetical protein